MTPSRLRECLALLRWSQRGLAGAIGYDEARLRKWARGAGTVPAEVAAWLERLCGRLECRAIRYGFSSGDLPGAVLGAESLRGLAAVPGMRTEKTPVTA
jgi:transcriptional regulator with XRE-family HTH domain